MPSPLPVPCLTGRLVRLEPLGPAHIADLVVAATADRSTFGFTSVPATRQALEEQVQALQELQGDGEVVPFAQVRAADGRAVGMTRYLSIRRVDSAAAAPYAVEIGGTWLAADAQGSGMNREAKLLLLTHAFEQWEVGRVDFKTDARNERSRRAIAALGATFEGVLRNWQPSHVVGEEGRLRDSAIYAVTAEDWPDVRERLAQRVHQ